MTTDYQASRTEYGTPEDERSEKPCSRCGVIQTLGVPGDPTTSAFYIKYNKRADDSRQFYWSAECKACWNRVVRLQQEERRARMGDEAFRRHQKEIRDRSRAKVRGEEADAEEQVEAEAPRRSSGPRWTTRVDAQAWINAGQVDG